MINPKELRIGNIINSSGLAMVVLRIYEDRVFCQEYEPKTILEVPKDIDATPIPLTHEILEKAGFKKGHEENDYYIELFNETVGEDYFILFENDNGTFKIPDYDIEIKSIHQLQNLYFALTGEELEIKL